jgi:hypothetical protein
VPPQSSAASANQTAPTAAEVWAILWNPKSTPADVARIATADAAALAATTYEFPRDIHDNRVVRWFARLDGEEVRVDALADRLVELLPAVRANGDEVAARIWSNLAALMKGMHASLHRTQFDELFYDNALKLRAACLQQQTRHVDAATADAINRQIDTLFTAAMSDQFPETDPE